MQDETQVPKTGKGIKIYALHNKKDGGNSVCQEYRYFLQG